MTEEELMNSSKERLELEAYVEEKLQAIEKEWQDSGLTVSKQDHQPPTDQFTITFVPKKKKTPIDPTTEAIRIGKQIVSEGEIDSTEYSDEYYLDLFWGGVHKNVDILRKVTWRHGSWATVMKYRDVFVSFDEVQNHGPFSSYEEAEDILEISELHDKIDHDVHF